MKTHKIAVLGVLLALASVTFLLEALLPPPVPIVPYVKLGLSNIFILLAIAWFNCIEGFIIVLAKNIITAFVSGWFAFIFNIVGSLFAFFSMYILYKVCFPKISFLAISMVGAVLSNILRTATASLLLNAPALFLQLPFIVAVSIGGGLLVGSITALLVQVLPKKLQQNFCSL